MGVAPLFFFIEREGKQLPTLTEPVFCGEGCGLEKQGTDCAAAFVCPDSHSLEMAAILDSSPVFLWPVILSLNGTAQTAWVSGCDLYSIPLYLQTLGSDLQSQKLTQGLKANVCVFIVSLTWETHCLA